MVTRRYTRKKIRRGNKDHNEFEKSAFNKILRNHVKNLNKTLNSKYKWDKVICGISIGLPSRLNNKGNNNFFYFTLVHSSFDVEIEFFLSF